MAGDDTRARAALRASGSTFLGFIALFIAVSGVANLIENLPVYIGATIQQTYGSGYLAPTHVASQVIKTMFSPLWLRARTPFSSTMVSNLQGVDQLKPSLLVEMNSSVRTSPL